MALKVKFKVDELHAVRNSNIKQISAHPPTFLEAAEFRGQEGQQKWAWDSPPLEETHKICGSGVGLCRSAQELQGLEILQKVNTLGLGPISERVSVLCDLAWTTNHRPNFGVIVFFHLLIAIAVYVSATFFPPPEKRATQDQFHIGI